MPCVFDSTPSNHIQHNFNDNNRGSRFRRPACLNRHIVINRALGALRLSVEGDKEFSSLTPQASSQFTIGRRRSTLLPTSRRPRTFSCCSNLP
ncbi:hypothetical protein PC121_g6398 [Phytophthora cactorum]|nr:hypothetical protein PC120_g4609 [Phytophthora cactorum]KAG3081664.1 hypothetical protein PC121_g6398 [Phytophthora cactorum]